MLQGNPIVKRRLAKMEKQSKLYSTTEELTRILGVRKHTLFHYDEIGPFSPVLKEGNGYRYYFIWQTDTFEVIRVLQKLGMSLGEIKEYMENRSPEHSTSMMDGKKCQIDEGIRRLENVKHFIPHEEELVQLATKVTLDEPRLVERDREHLFVPGISAGLERKAAAGITEYMRMQEKYHDTVGAVGSIYLGENMDRSIYNRYVKVYTRLDKKTTSRRVQSRPEGVYVELHSRGYLWDMKKPHCLISALAREQGIRLDQMWYEDLMLDELAVKRYKQYIVKVTVPVESKVINP